MCLFWVHTMAYRIEWVRFPETLKNRSYLGNFKPFWRKLKMLIYSKLSTILEWNFHTHMILPNTQRGWSQVTPLNSKMAYGRHLGFWLLGGDAFGFFCLIFICTFFSGFKSSIKPQNSFLVSVWDWRNVEWGVSELSECVCLCTCMLFCWRNLQLICWKL